MCEIHLPKEALKKLKPGSRAKLLFEGTYEATAPLMIGGFDGDHYKLLQTTDGHIVGVTLTGLPTAKSIIGKARWLLRVAIAHVLGLNNHKAAEKALPITVGDYNVPLVPLLFGGINAAENRKDGKRYSWKGLINVIVTPSGEISNYSLEKKAEISDDHSIVEIILEERKKIIHNEFVEAKYIKKNRKIKCKTNLSSNRFNANLALGAYCHKTSSEDSNANGEIIPVKEEQKVKIVRHIEPIKEEYGRFKLSITIDNRRLKSIRGTHRGNIIQYLEELVTLILGGVPILLGLGKGSTRGFGHFALKSFDECKFFPSSSSNTRNKVCEILLSASRPSDVNDTMRYFNQIKSIIKNISINLNIRTFKTATIGDSKIPRLPTLSESFIFVSTSTIRNPLQAVEKLGRAATKICWKTELLRRNFKSPGTDLHSWPLGLPRKVIIKNDNICKYRGYILLNNKGGLNPEYHRKDLARFLEENMAKEEERRQSIIVAFRSGNDRIVAFMFPSGDLADLTNPKNRRTLYIVGKHKADEECDAYRIYEIAKGTHIKKPKGRQLGVTYVDPSKGGRPINRTLNLNIPKDLLELQTGVWSNYLACLAKLGVNGRRSTVTSGIRSIEGFRSVRGEHSWGLM